MIVSFRDKEAEKIWCQDLHYPHPGEILKTEFLDELGITQYRLAVDTKIPRGSKKKI